MQAIHRYRRFGRLLAAWLLLWFLAMSAAPFVPLSAAGPRAAASADSETEDVANCDAAEHHHHHAEQSAQEPDACAPSQVDVHAGHGAGSLSHCPLCLQGAAPPPEVLAALLRADAPAERPAVVSRSVRRTRTDVPPPARGPPLLLSFR